MNSRGNMKTQLIGLPAGRWQELTALLGALCFGLLSLGGCGGSKGDSVNNEFSNISVAATGSPLANSTGVKSTMGNSTIFALTADDGAGSNAMRISISPADPSIKAEVVAGSVFKIEGATRATDMVYVESPESVSVVYSCSRSEMKCIKVPFARAGAGIRFAADSNDFFALKK